MYIFGSYLTAVFELRKQNMLFMISVFISIGLNLILIPEYGPVGAAITALITQSFTTAGLIIIGHLHLKEIPDIGRIIRIIIFFAVLTVSGLLLEQLNLSWMIEIALFLMVSITSAFLLQLLQWREFTELLKKRENFTEG